MSAAVSAVGKPLDLITDVVYFTLELGHPLHLDTEFLINILDLLMKAGHHQDRI